MRLLFDKLPESAPTKHGYVDCTTTCMAHWQCDYAQLSPFHLLSTLSITYSRQSHAVPYNKQKKDGRGLGTRLVTPQSNHSTHNSCADYIQSLSTFIANNKGAGFKPCQQTF